MRFIKIFLLSAVLMNTLSLVQAGENAVAKVLLMKGKVTATLADGKNIEVNSSTSLPEGTSIQTSEKSFIKLIFIDKSQMNLGPNSQMVITAFPKKEAGIITLVKGQLRSQVTKDYMEMEDKTKSKLFIKSKTAALGIRGTDFQVNYNPENFNTALITFEGKVAMAHIERNQREDSFDQNRLEKVVSSDKAVMVERGQISAVNLNIAERAMTPTLLGTKQIEALKDNETGTKESAESDKKQFRNPLPPGVESTLFTNVAPEKAAVITSSSTGTTKDPNGFFNNKTGEYKLPAGSIIDLNTVNIIPPPTNAVFDPNSKTFIVPENFGKIDKTTGEYKAPEGLKLGNDGKFTVVDPDAYLKSQKVNKEEKKEEKKEDKKEEKKEEKKEDKKEDKKEEKKVDGAAPPSQTAASGATNSDNTRAPASAPAPSPAPALAPVIEAPKIYDARPDMANFAGKYAASPVSPSPQPVISPTLQEKAQEKLTTTEIVNNNNTQTGTAKTTTKVKIIFNAQ